VSAPTEPEEGNNVLPILVFSEPETNIAPFLTRERVRTAAAIYLGVKLELMKFDGVTEDFAREHAENARDAYIRQCCAGRAK
jgi:hypothetical protein